MLRKGHLLVSESGDVREGRMKKGALFGSLSAGRGGKGTEWLYGEGGTALLLFYRT